MRGDGGRADVDGEAVELVVVAGADGDDAVAAVHGHRHLPGTLAQRALQALERAQVDGEVAEAPLAGKRFRHALEIAALAVHVGLLDLDEMEPDGGVELDGADLGPLAHHLLVDLALGRHVDDDIALEQRLAGEAAAGREAAAGAIALLDLGH